MPEDPVTETPPEPVVAPAEPEAPPPVPPGTPTYHVAIWEQPLPLYVCLLCPADAPRFPLEDVKAHIPTVHNCDAVPTETIPMLIALRADADARMAVQEALEAQRQATAPTTPPEAPTPESLPTQEAPDARGADVS